MDLSVYIARQPIFDENRNIFAYDLLYRDTDANSVSVDNNLRATARVLINALHYIGLNNLTKGKMAFLKVDDKTIMGDVINSISPSHFILQLLEGTDITPALLDRIAKLHKKGYRFSLRHTMDDNAFIDHFLPVLSNIDYIKIDIQRNIDPAKTIASLSLFPFTFIAEKIEEQEMFDKAVSAGFHYFQGFLFSKPVLLKKGRVDPLNSQLLELLTLLKSNVPLDTLKKKFNTSPYLTVNLLKFVRTHEQLAHDTISSIEQALVLIGREKLSNWVELMVYAGGEKDSKEENETRVLSHLAHQRACLMEEVAKVLEKPQSFLHAAYMTGLLSVTGTMFEEGFSSLLKQVYLDKNIAGALLKMNGELGQLLHLSIAVEKDDLAQINAICAQLRLSQKELNKCLVASYRRAESEALE